MSRLNVEIGHDLYWWEFLPAIALYGARGHKRLMLSWLCFYVYIDMNTL